MSAIESPQNWFEDPGSTQLVNGSAVVVLDRDYIQTVNTETEYQVFLTPYGQGLNVANRTVSSFEVHELRGRHHISASNLSWVAESSSWSFSKKLCNNPPHKICLETKKNGGFLKKNQ
jgi:hypothetical protein